jgi:hypothetical protein
MFEQHRQDLARLLLKLDPTPLLTQFSRAKVNFKNSKSQEP